MLRWALGTLLLWSTPALAQEVEGGSRDAEARAFFEAGRTAFLESQYADALEHFQRSYELSGRPELLYNIGSAADRLRRDDVALEAYRAYLDARPDTERRASVEERIRFLSSAQSGAGPAEPAEPTDGGGSVLGMWWLWTIVAVVLIGGGVAIGVGVASSGERVQEPLPGSVGGVVMTLGAAL